MAELPDIDAAVYTKLVNDAGVSALVSSRVYVYQAQKGAALPYVIFYIGSGIIENLQPRDTFNHVYRVESRALSNADCKALHRAVYAALHEATLTISGWGVYWCAVETETRLIENVDGVQYHRFILDVRIRGSKD